MRFLTKTHKTKAWLANLREIIDADLLNHKGGGRRKKRHIV